MSSNAFFVFPEDSYGSPVPLDMAEHLIGSSLLHAIDEALDSPPKQEKNYDPEEFSRSVDELMRHDALMLSKLKNIITKPMIQKDEEEEEKIYQEFQELAYAIYDIIDYSPKNYHYEMYGLSGKELMKNYDPEEFSRSVDELMVHDALMLSKLKNIITKPMIEEDEEEEDEEKIYQEHQERIAYAIYEIIDYSPKNYDYEMYGLSEKELMKYDAMMMNKLNTKPMIEEKEEEVEEEEEEERDQEREERIAKAIYEIIDYSPKQEQNYNYGGYERSVNDLMEHNAMMMNKLKNISTERPRNIMAKEKEEDDEEEEEEEVGGYMAAYDLLMEKTFKKGSNKWRRRRHMKY